MTFRSRLTLFFLLIVVLPMVAVGVLVVEVTGSAGTGKTDARLAAGLDTAIAVDDERVAASRQAARQAARDPGLLAALRSGDQTAVESAARSVHSNLDLASLTVRGPAGGPDRPIVRVGSPDAIAHAEVAVRSEAGDLGLILASTTRAGAFARQIRELTGEDVAVVRGGRPIASTTRLDGADLPDEDGGTDTETRAGDVRAAGVRLPAAGPDASVVLLGTPEESGFEASEPIVATALVLFFALAFVFIVMLVRALQGQVAAMLDAARRIGSGDFSRRVPADGNDEMAGLAREFNKMSDRLSAQMAELRKQREELDQSVQRIGEAFASGLDRTALLEIVVETALAACDASVGRIALTGRDGVEAKAGPTPGSRERAALEGAEEEARRGHADGVARRGEAYALAHALTPAGRPEALIGTLAIARTGPAFTASEREVLRYLIGQASVSMENIGLHEIVAEQAVTDELTGLSNNRHFREWIEGEVARAERFGHELSLVMLDIDDFKPVNDTYGHLQGDEVLRAVGAVLALESRGVDEPARYGGEEFVVGLPETDADGALEVAERIRVRIERTEIPGANGQDPIRVTASLGVASMRSATDPTGLVAAADEALYRAKREGKNRCLAAPPRAPGSGSHDGARETGDPAQGPASARRR